MSSVFLKEMKRNMDEDAALTQQSDRQEMQEDRTPETEFMPIEQEDSSLQEDMMMDTQPVEQPDGDMDFMFDGLLEALKRRSSKE